MKHHFKRIFVAASFLCLTLNSGLAAVFNIDTNRSALTLSGTVLGFPLQEQSLGSLTTPFAGMIIATVTDATIVFTGSSLIAAQNNGNWAPKAKGEPGSDPANFGGKASSGVLGSVLAAVRNSDLDLTSALLPLASGSFDSSSILFQFLTNNAGSLDYSVSGLFAAKGSIALAGLSTNRVTSRAMLSTSSNTQTLTIPVAADFYFKLLSANDTLLTMSGQIVATRSLGAASGPAIGIALEADGRVALSWPASATGFVVLQSPTITPASGWIQVTDQPVLESGSYVIRLKPQSQTEFYRLAAGIPGP